MTIKSGEDVVIDTETTGLNNGMRLDLPVSIAIIGLDSGDVLLNTMVNPEMAIDPGASAVHGITDAMLVSAPRLIDVIDDAALIFKRASCIWAYNAPFDLRIMGNAMAACGMHVGHRLCADAWRDAMAEYNAAWAQPGERGDLRWQTLTAAIEQQDMALLDAHGALNDAMMTRNLLLRLRDGDVRRWTPGARQVVSITSVTPRHTGKAGRFLMLTTRGGQKINVFQVGVGQLYNRGYPTQDWLNSVLDEPIELIAPLRVEMEYSEYNNLRAVLTDYALPVIEIGSSDES